MSAPPPPTAAPAPHPGRSVFDITLAMFWARKPAVAAAGVLVAAFYAVIWAPLLATSAPLSFRGYDRGAARQAVRLSYLEIEDIQGALRGRGPGGVTWTRGNVEESFRVVDFQLGRLLEILGGDLAARVTDLRGRCASVREAWAAPRAPVDPAVPVPVDAATADSLAPLAATLRNEIRPTEGDFASRSRFPAFRGLGGLDLLLLVASLTAPVGILLGLRGGPGRVRRPRRAAAIALLPALAAAGLGWALAPAREDFTDYKRGIREKTIVAEGVIYAPVPYGINQNDLQRKFEAPFAEPPEGRERHLLGTDENGRDMLCRMLWGGRVSLSVGFVAVGIYVFLGIVVGAVAGFFGGWIDIVVSRFIEWVICFPVFVLVLVIAAFLQERTVFGMDPPQLVIIMVVIGITGWTGVARLVRAEFLRLVNQDFVMAARALGARRRSLMFGHLLPNAMAPVLVAATFGVAGAILTESALSFLGLGITVPKPSWGGMLNAAHGYEQTSVSIFLWPGLAIFMVITCYNLVGEALRDALDPRLRQ